MTKRWLPIFVSEYQDRHGKPHYRFRRKGCATYHFKHPPGSTEFMAEYRAALDSEAPAPPERYEPGTVDAVAMALYGSPRWRSMKPSSRTTYQRIIDRFREGNGTLKVATIRTRHIDEKLASMASTPSAANNLRKSLSRLFKQAIKMGLVDVNPVTATDTYRTGSEGFHTWTESEIAAFDARWAFGTRQRLAKELMICTALRRSDAYRVGASSIDGDKLRLGHQKTSAETIIPIMPDLARALDGFAHLDPFVRTEAGKPFSSPDSFANWFRRATAAAGIPHCTPHGLRKAISRRLAESGATNQQGRSVTGHVTDKEFSRYAAKANRKAMAKEAMANVADRFAIGREEND